MISGDKKNMMDYKNPVTHEGDRCLFYVIFRKLIMCESNEAYKL